MGYLPSVEQDQLAAGVRRFLGEQLPLPTVRVLTAAGDGFDAALWSTVAGPLDLLGLAVPVEFGGSGGGYRDQALVAEEIGAALCPLPYLSTVALAGPVLLQASDAARERWLPGVLNGSVRAAVAVSDAASGAIGGAGTADDDRRTSTSTRARAENGRVTLHGAKSFVLDGSGADVLFVWAQATDGPELFAVEAAAHGVVRQPLATLDPSRPMAEVIFDGCAAERLGAGVEALGRVEDLARMILAMEQVGAARQCLAMSTEYARTRTQFGRKIGSFQAVKHRCAEMFVALESARVAALHAAWAADVAPAELPVAASAAKALASEALLFCAKQNIQIHGGIGVTAEHDAHLYYRRAHSSNLLFGRPAAHRRRLAAQLGLAAEDAP
jgi:alkylation response protein AidB-like acyl-CoA dehydrogenase